MRSRLRCLLSLLALGACSADGTTPDAAATPPFDGHADALPAAAPVCTPCVDGSDCPGGACVQYAGSDFCAPACQADADCGAGRRCMGLVDDEGAIVNGCVPVSGTCGASGCAGCPGGGTCDVLSGLCVTPDDDGGGATPDGGGGSGSDGGGGSDGGSGASDGGTTLPTGSVGPNGGSVSRLYFAVIGDTRPPKPDDTAAYPSAIIHRIYHDIETMTPRPQFVVTTGDYMFAKPYGTEGPKQVALYEKAARQFTGPVFASVGNHECGGAVASNCASTITHNMKAYLDTLVKPLGKTLPYYAVPVKDTAGKWTAKILIAACNAWDGAEKKWFTDEMAKATTYTFVVRHEPLGTVDAPCVPEMDAILGKSKYDLLLVGHAHTYSHSGKQVIVGNGGAPLTGPVSYGFATVEQRAAGDFVVKRYDYLSGMPVGSFTVP